MSREEVIKKIYNERSDISTFLIHLTRDHEDGTTAKDAFDNILSTNPYKLIAKNPIGLFCNFPDTEDTFEDSNSSEMLKEFLKAICFTEAPLDQVKHFIGPNLQRGNLKKLIYSKYGFVFTRDFIQKQKGNPCFYVSTDINNKGLKLAFLNLWNPGEWEKFKMPDFIPDSSIFRILPFVNIFGRNANDQIIDYVWEREWRVPKSQLEFRAEDLVVALCKETEISFYSKKYSDITFISSSWSLDRIITALADKGKKIATGIRT